MLQRKWQRSSEIKGVIEIEFAKNIKPILRNELELK